MDSMDANLYQYYTGVWTRVMKGHRPVLHRFVDSWIQGTRTCIRTAQSPGEIKRMEVSWTLKKKLDTFAGPGEIRRREVVLDPQVSPKEIMSREVELGCESWTCFFVSRCSSTAVQRTLSL